MKRYTVEVVKHKSAPPPVAALDSTAAKEKRAGVSTPTAVSKQQVRMIQLTSEYFKSRKKSGGRRADEDEDEEEGEDEEGEGLGEDGGGASGVESVLSSLGKAQSHQLPLFAQMFAQIEQVGKAGISLKQIGTLFAFDFYKSRRMGNNLQSHPDVVTILKETNKGKTKFQTIVLRRFRNLNSNNKVRIKN